MVPPTSSFNTSMAGSMAGMTAQGSYQMTYTQQMQVQINQQHQIPRPPQIQRNMGPGPMGPGSMGPHPAQMGAQGPNMGPHHVPPGGPRPQMRPQMRPEVPLNQVYVHQQSHAGNSSVGKSIF